MPPKKKNYTFVLKDINTEKIENTYSINTNLLKEVPPLPVEITKISDLVVDKNTTDISFFDESKRIHKCSISMIDFYSLEELKQHQLYDCFWCKSSIPLNIKCIGCPIKYQPNQLIKQYHSEISKDKYIIKENIISSSDNIIDDIIDDNKQIKYNTVMKDYYITDGIFCSFNCCKAYIIDNRYNCLYDRSDTLLLKMYNDLYNTSLTIIEPAPHWRKLKKYGGDLTIDEFRNTFNKVIYKDHGIIQNFSRKTKEFKSIGFLYEETLKF